LYIVKAVNGHGECYLYIDEMGEASVDVVVFENEEDASQSAVLYVENHPLDGVWVEEVRVVQ